MKLKGTGSFKNVPVHGTIEKRTVTQTAKDGTTREVEKCLMSLRGTMTPDKAQATPSLVQNWYKDAEGKSRQGITQFGSVDQFDRMLAAAGDQAVELHDKDGKATGKYAVAFSADLMPNSQHTGLVPNTAKPMGPNPIAVAAGWKDEKSAAQFMEDQRNMAKAAGEMRKQFIADNNLDTKNPDDRAKIPDIYDVSGKSEPAAPAAEAKPAEAKAKRPGRGARKTPDAPSAPEEQQEDEAALV